MTDAALGGGFDWSSEEARARRRRRYSADRRLQALGIGAITVAIGLLGILLVTLTVQGYTAFTQTMITVDFPISTENVDPDNPAAGNWRAVVRDGLHELFPNV